MQEANNRGQVRGAAARASRRDRMVVAMAVVVALLFVGTALTGFMLFLRPRPVCVDGSIAVTATVHLHTNQSVGNDTDNGGVWEVRVAAVSNAIRVTDARVLVDDPTGAVLVDIRFRDIELRVGLTDGPVRGALVRVLPAGSPAVYDPDPARENAPDPPSTPFDAVVGVSEAQMLTAERVQLAYVDRGSVGMVDSTDSVLIFRSIDGDPRLDVPDGSRLHWRVWAETSGPRCETGPPTWHPANEQTLGRGRR